MANHFINQSSIGASSPEAISADTLVTVHVRGTIGVGACLVAELADTDSPEKYKVIRQILPNEKPFVVQATGQLRFNLTQVGTGTSVTIVTS